MERNAILYISNILPARSETFVYRELFALRDLGLIVHAASVHAPERDLGTSQLDTLANEAIPIYGSGAARLLYDCILEVFCHPFSAFPVFCLSLRDMSLGADLNGRKRAKVGVQALAAVALARRVRRLHIVHIHAHMASVPTTIAMYAAKQLGIGFSFTGHANDIFTNRSLLKEKIARAVFVSCISRWHKDFYSSIFPKGSSGLPIIRCGVDTTKETAVPATHGEAFSILSVGRLVAKKGLDVLVEAVGLIARRGLVRVALTIAGEGPEDRRLRAQVAGLPSSARVEMLGGVSNERVMELMARCELFVLPLRITPEGDRDGIPVVLMEAMARGRCVISGDLVTIRELIEHGSSGYLIPTGDVQALADIIEALAGNRSLIDTIGAKARERIVDEFDVAKNASALLARVRVAGIRV